MTRQARIARLEAKHGGADAGPTVIYICEAETGDPFAAIIPGRWYIRLHSRKFGGNRDALGEV